MSVAESTASFAISFPILNSSLNDALNVATFALILPFKMLTFTVHN